jgi:hypothetical protein
MKTLLFDDQETIMIYVSVMMLKDEADDYAPAISKLLDKMRIKIEEYLGENPLAMNGLIMTLESEPELMRHPRAAQLVELLKHFVAAARIVEDMKGLTEECSLCNGHGSFMEGSGLPCPRCAGSGKLNKKETYN